MTTFAWVLLGLYCVLLAAAGVQDLFSRKISNLLSLAVFAIGLAALGAGALAGPWWQHLVSFAVTLAGGLLLFSRGWLGGGDVKLLAAAALWFNLKELLSFVLAVAMIGGVLALVMIALRMTVLGGGLAKSGLAGAKRGASVPYGIPIALAAIALSVMGMTQKPAPDSALPAYQAAGLQGTKG